MTATEEKPMSLVRRIYAALGIMGAIAAAGFTVAMYFAGMAKAEVVDALSARLIRVEEDQRGAEIHLARVDVELQWARQQLLEIARATGARIVPAAEPPKGK